MKQNKEILSSVELVLVAPPPHTPPDPLTKKEKQPELKYRKKHAFFWFRFQIEKGSTLLSPCLRMKIVSCWWSAGNGGNVIETSYQKNLSKYKICQVLERNRYE